MVYVQQHINNSYLQYMYNQLMYSPKIHILPSVIYFILLVILL